MSKKIKEIVLANPRGFCAGVDRAIDIVEKSLEKYDEPVFVRHQVVHNKRVVESLEKKGVKFVKEVSEIPDNAVAITSTGQQLIKFTADIGNKFYTKELKKDKDYCIYTDTDSTFFSSLPIIEHRYPDYDITNEIRALKGITIVTIITPEDYTQTGDDEYVRVRLKFVSRGEAKEMLQQFLDDALSTSPGPDEDDVRIPGIINMKFRDGTLKRL